MPLADVAEQPLVEGLAEFLHEHGVIDTIVYWAPLRQAVMWVPPMPDVIELSEAVTFEVRGHYAVITIDRPETPTP